ncbi:MAG: HIRAN domain-containing protein [Vampirovibrionia bacterium]
MLNLNLNTVNPLKIGPKIDKLNLNTSFGKTEQVNNCVNYSIDNLQANFLPLVSFKGIHKDAVVGVETLIVGISHHQDTANNVKFRFLNRNKRSAKDKIQLKLERESDNKFKDNAIAVYHEYRGKTGKLGYINDDMSGLIAPLIDKGYKFNASVVNVGGDYIGFKSPYVGVRMRLEYLSTPERSPNQKKLKHVQKAFKECLQNGSALNYREEKIVNSKQYKKATKMKVDVEKGEVTVYKSGWRQLKGDLKPGAHPRNKRAHSQDREFVDHVKRSMDYFIRKPVQQEILFPEQKPAE